MSARFFRSVRPTLLLVVTGLWLTLPLGSSILPVSPAAAAKPVAAAPSGATLTLSSQSTWVGPSQPQFSLQVVPTDPDQRLGPLELVVTVYEQLHTRTAFTQALTGIPAGGVLDQTAPIAVSSTGVTQTLTMQVGTGATGPRSPNSVIGLDCSKTCAGVYPVVVALRQKASGDTLARLNTFLTYVQAASSDPLRFAMVLPFASPVQVNPQARDPAATLGVPSHTEVAGLGALVDAVAAQPGVATTLLVDPYTVQGLLTEGSQGRQAMSALGALSSVGSDTEIPSTSYVPVDLSALAGAGLSGEITYQMQVGSAIMDRTGIRTDTASSTWVVSGAVNQSLAAGLVDAGLNRVLIPSSDLATDSDRLGITQPFGLTFGHGTPVTAAATDSGLAAHFEQNGRDPVLAAQQLLADLAFIEYQDPYDPATRGVVAVAPQSPPSARFITTVLDGLAQNPNLRAVTLDQFFAQVPAGGNGAPPTRQAASGGGSSIAPALADKISQARQRNDAFHSAVSGTPPVLGQLDDLLLATESDDLSPRRQLGAVALYEQALGAQLAQVQLSTVRTITLTSRTGGIPITFLSTAPYTFVGDVTLTSDKFVFPDGATRDGYRISRSTDPIPIEVEARTSGDLPLEVTLVAPHTDPGAAPLVIAHGELTIRSTATSLVGVLLTVFAIAVLLTWWARTWRKGRRVRAAGRAHDAPSTGSGPSP